MAEVTGSGSITSTGKVVFTDDLRDVGNVSDGGSLTVQSRRLSSSRRIEISASNGRRLALLSHVRTTHGASGAFVSGFSAASITILASGRQEWPFSRLRGRRMNTVGR
jgi:hypothetical protein